MTSEHEHIINTAKPKVVKIWCLNLCYNKLQPPICWVSVDRGSRSTINLITQGKLKKFW